jgi:hypothetical protein
VPIRDRRATHTAVAGRSVDRRRCRTSDTFDAAPVASWPAAPRSVRCYDSSMDIVRPGSFLVCLLSACAGPVPPIDVAPVLPEDFTSEWYTVSCPAPEGVKGTAFGRTRNKVSFSWFTTRRDLFDKEQSDTACGDRRDKWCWDKFSSVVDKAGFWSEDSDLLTREQAKEILWKGGSTCTLDGEIYANGIVQDERIKAVPAPGDAPRGTPMTIVVDTVLGAGMGFDCERTDGNPEP